MSGNIVTQSELHIGRLTQLGHQVCQNTNYMASKQLMDNVDLLNHSLRDHSQKLQIIQSDFEVKLNLWSDWSMMRANIEQRLNAIGQRLITMVMDTIRLIEMPVITLLGFIGLKDVQIKECKVRMGLLLFSIFIDYF